jgi:Icc-related predicted phosphoesterase
VLAIFGNDDPRAEEGSLAELERRGLLHHVHGRRLVVAGATVYGYACVPPTPFLLKDWERYDVSRFVDPGSVSPEEGRRSVPVPEGEARWGTIAGDLEALVGADDVSGAVFLFHSPPYRTALDRAALDGQAVDHAPLDVHVGSIAIRRFIEARQPLATLHGHVHESARLTGAWQERIGRTVCLSAAHDGPELALVRFDLEAPAAASRELV